MSTFTRTWPALFAWGAGLIDVALAASISAGKAAPSGILVMSGLLVVAAGALFWGAASIRAGRALAPRICVAAAMGGPILAAGAVVVGCSAIAAGVSLVLTMTAGVLVVPRWRRRAGNERPRATMLGTLAGAVLVAALITPALSTTDATAHSTTFPTAVDPHAGH